jgi:glutamate dehydrogenase
VLLVREQADVRLSEIGGRRLVLRGVPVKKAVAAVRMGAIEECLERLPGDIPLGRQQCARALQQALQRSCLDERTVLSRFLWLADPSRPEADGIRLFAHRPSLTEDGLAEAVIHPRAVVLDVIHERTGLERDFLSRIYEEILGNGGPADFSRIADLTEERILQEMKWWLTDLKFPEYYLRNTPPELMARQIMLNRSYALSGLDSEAYAHMKVSSTAPDGTSLHWVHRRRVPEVEEEIEREYYGGGQILNVAVYAPIPDLLMYVVYRSPDAPQGRTMEDTAPASFLGMSDSAARGRYEAVRREVLDTGRIVIAHSRKEETGETRLMIGFPRGSINHFQANISRVAERNGIELTRKYTVTFGGARPVIVATLYARGDFPDDLLSQLVEVSLYPPGLIGGLVEKGAITPAEANFLNAAVPFIHQFITVPDPDVGLLTERFHADRELSGILSSIQARMDRDAYPLALIEQVFEDRTDIVHDLFRLFSARLSPDDRSPEEEHGARGRLDAVLASGTLTAEEAEVVRTTVRFVDAVARTNFFLPVKAALSFRLDRGFFSRAGVESVPFGVFFVVGRSFHGFHVRFKDIARGGIRLLRSATYDEHHHNADALFEECYNLAFTQNKKNKDIPEGGSKGIILPAFGSSPADAREAFHCYIDALLDLLVPGESRFVAGWEEEILFFGPDEGTADLMDWACLRARERGYRYWKAVTTGKDASLGGISHKEHGMTTQGVHRYVLGILRELGIAEQSITKAQTGGPDGDLGSNEILLSEDRTIALVDGGGVVCDPEGLRREELVRLARAGATSAEFDRSLLGPRGFLVRVQDRDVVLPDGTRVASGLGFRNTFHLDPRMKADLFVPCGGRPKSVNLSNWRSLLDGDGRPLFRWIVEGANLFITQDARLRLEEKGVVLFKDSSTNKGGVISSSFEVLAGLALTDGEYEELMTVRSGSTEVPSFRARYVAEAIDAIRRKADQEFGLLWRTRAATGAPLSVLSETVSSKINEITIAIERSTLYDSEAIRRNSLRMHAPPALVEKIGLEDLMARLPESYQRAILARSVASNFVYQYGLEAGFEDYRQYVEELAAWRGPVRTDE